MTRVAVVRGCIMRSFILVLAINSGGGEKKYMAIVAIRTMRRNRGII